MIQGKPFYSLDATGDAALSGIRSVRSEVEFLRDALMQEPLLLHGEALSRWATTFAAGRQIACKAVSSPLGQLQHLLPGLSAASGQVLLTRWPQLYEETSLRYLAARLMDGRPLGSAEHAAAWLLRRLEAPPEEQSAFVEVGKALAGETDDAWQPVYLGDEADLKPLLLGWLSMRVTPHSWPAPFPLALEGVADKLVRQEAWQQLSEQGFQAFSSWQGAAIQMQTLGALATAKWLIDHPEALTPSTLQRLRPLLPMAEYQSLAERLPIKPPSPLPADPADWAVWMEHEYLPFRASGKTDQQAILPLLRDFAQRFLTVYAKALNGGPHDKRMVWARSAALREQSKLTLLVICDGLSLYDLAVLRQHLAQEDTAQRLDALGHEVTFPALPTITHEAKPALLRGVAPTMSAQAAPLGFSSTSEVKVRAALETGRPGEIVFWNYVQTDKLYHDAETLEAARSTANAILMNLAQRLVKLMLEAVPLTIPAQMVITTDHGRLLLESQRSVPHAFKPEGRAAFGEWKNIPAQGFELRDHYALLGRTTFGMTEDAAVMWGNETFLKVGGAKGREVCPHGGITPEEVLIPWAVYGRDLDLKLPTFQLVGKGQAEQPGTLVVRATNANALPLTVSGMSGSLAPYLDALFGWILPPSTTLERPVDLTSWPKSQAVLTLGVTVRAGERVLPEINAESLLKTDELYNSTSNILDDLL
jgi:hypothetical protein